MTSSSPAPAAAPVLVDRPHEGTPVGLLVALGLLALTLLFVLLALAARRFGWGEERFAGVRHAWGEAAYRAGGTWGDFLDWVRLGRWSGPLWTSGQLPWWIGGPVMGLCVVAIRGLLNARLGVTGAFSEVIDRVGRRSLELRLARLVSHRPRGGRVRVRARARRPGLRRLRLAHAHLRGRRLRIARRSCSLAGVLIGFGAKTAGGCTSGNGLTGTSMLSRAALAATATFFGTAIVVSFAIEALT